VDAVRLLLSGQDREACDAAMANRCGKRKGGGGGADTVQLLKRPLFRTLRAPLPRPASLQLRAPADPGASILAMVASPAGTCAPPAAAKSMPQSAFATR
jgi:hypothetical protein